MVNISATDTLDLQEKKNILFKIWKYFDNKDFLNFIENINNDEQISFVFEYILAKDEKTRKILWNKLEDKMEKSFETLKNIKRKSDLLKIYLNEEKSKNIDVDDLKEISSKF